MPENALSRLTAVAQTTGGQGQSTPAPPAINGRVSAANPLFSPAPSRQCRRFHAQPNAHYRPQAQMATESELLCEVQRSFPQAQSRSLSGRGRRGNTAPALSNKLRREALAGAADPEAACDRQGFCSYPRREGMAGFPRTRHNRRSPSISCLTLLPSSCLLVECQDVRLPSWPFVSGNTHA